MKRDQAVMPPPRDYLADDFPSRPVSSKSAPGRDLLAEPGKPEDDETLGQAFLMAVPRMASDLSGKLYGFANDIPGYYEKAKTELPGLLDSIRSHPGHVAAQGLAGVNEAINALAQSPVALARYGSENLNLLPKGAPGLVKKYGMVPEDTTEAIDQVFGSPQYPGEALTRGVGRNFLNVVPAAKAAAFLNPLKLTNKSLIKDVLGTGAKEEATHSAIYNDIFNEAKYTGYDRVPVDWMHLLKQAGTIKNHISDKKYSSLMDLIVDPTIENAHRAKSVLKSMDRNLDRLAERRILNDQEAASKKAIRSSIEHIDDRMFDRFVRNDSGKIVRVPNKDLKKRYSDINTSYLENVVPYKYNAAINKFKNKDITESELINALTKGAFAAKKGDKHKLLMNRKKIKNALAGAGILSGADFIRRELSGERGNSHE